MTARRFSVGDAVRTRTMNPAGHTRLPAYLRNKHGVIEAVHGLYPLADERARGNAEAPPQMLYTVVFRADEVWGNDGDGGSTISADLWESYLEPEARA